MREPEYPATCWHVSSKSQPGGSREELSPPRLCLCFRPRNSRFTRPGATFAGSLGACGDFPDDGLPTGRAGTRSRSPPADAHGRRPVRGGTAPDAGSRSGRDRARNSLSDSGLDAGRPAERRHAEAHSAGASERGHAGAGSHERRDPGSAGSPQDTRAGLPSSRPSSHPCGDACGLSYSVRIRRALPRIPSADLARTKPIPSDIQTQSQSQSQSTERCS